MQDGTIQEARPTPALAGNRQDQNVAGYVHGSWASANDPWQRIEALSARCVELENACNSCREELRRNDGIMSGMQQYIAGLHWQVSEYRGLLDRCPDMILAFALEGIVQFVSDACASALHYRPSELEGTDVSLLVPEPGRAEFRQRMAQQLYLQSKRPLLRKERVFFQQFLRRDGRATWMEGVGQAWQRGSSVQFVLSFRELGDTPEAAGEGAEAVAAGREAALGAGGAAAAAALAGPPEPAAAARADRGDGESSGAGTGASPSGATDLTSASAANVRAKGVILGLQEGGGGAASAGGAGGDGDAVGEGGSAQVAAADSAAANDVSGRSMSPAEGSELLNGGQEIASAAARAAAEGVTALAKGSREERGESGDGSGSSSHSNGLGQLGGGAEGAAEAGAAGWQRINGNTDIGEGEEGGERKRQRTEGNATADATGDASQPPGPAAAGALPGGTAETAVGASGQAVSGGGGVSGAMSRGAAAVSGMYTSAVSSLAGPSGTHPVERLYSLPGMAAAGLPSTWPSPMLSPLGMGREHWLGGGGASAASGAYGVDMGSAVAAAARGAAGAAAGNGGVGRGGALSVPGSSKAGAGGAAAGVSGVGGGGGSSNGIGGPSGLPPVPSYPGAVFTPGQPWLTPSGLMERRPSYAPSPAMSVTATPRGAGWSPIPLASSLPGVGGGAAWYASRYPGQPMPLHPGGGPPQPFLGQPLPPPLHQQQQQAPQPPPGPLQPPFGAGPPLVQSSSRAYSVARNLAGFT